MATPSKANPGCSEEEAERDFAEAKETLRNGLRYRVLRTILDLDPALIEIDETRNGRFAAPNADKIARMGRSLQENGQKAPIQVLEQNKAGKYPLYIGFTRTKAAIKVGLKLRAEVVEISEQDRLFGNAIENMDRNNLGTMDHALIVARGAVAGLKNVEIARRLGKSTAGVSKMQAISELPGKFHRYIQDGAITMDEAYELAKLTTAKQDRRFARLTEEPKTRKAKKSKDRKAAKIGVTADLFLFTSFREECKTRAAIENGKPASAVQRFYADLGKLLAGKMKFETLTEKWTVRLKS